MVQPDVAAGRLQPNLATLRNTTNGTAAPAATTARRCGTCAPTGSNAATAPASYPQVVASRATATAPATRSAAANQTSRNSDPVAGGSCRAWPVPPRQPTCGRARRRAPGLCGDVLGRRPDHVRAATVRRSGRPTAIIAARATTGARSPTQNRRASPQVRGSVKRCVADYRPLRSRQSPICETVLGTYLQLRIGCGQSCAAAHANGTCGASGCARVCQTGYGDCDTSSPDCEAPLDTAANCGACGVACPTDRPLCSGPRGAGVPGRVRGPAGRRLRRLVHQSAVRSAPLRPAAWLPIYQACERGHCCPAT